MKMNQRTEGKCPNCDCEGASLCPKVFFFIIYLFLGFRENVLKVFVSVCVQSNREGAHRKADQDAPQGDHDAEGPGECDL